MTLSISALMLAVGSVTYIMSIIALLISGVITQAAYCDSARKQCNLTRIGDHYKWYFINGSAHNCLYNGDISMDNNTWQIVNCFNNGGVNNTDIGNTYNYDNEMTCPQHMCNEWFISAGLFNTAIWMCVVGGGVLITICIIAAIRFLVKEVRQRFKSHNYNSNNRNREEVYSSYTTINVSAMNSSDTDHTNVSNNIYDIIHSGELTDPYDSSDSLVPQIAIYVEGT